MSDTPRTEHVLNGAWHRTDYESCIPDFCRQLERELNAANMKIDSFRRQREHDEGRIEYLERRLVECGEKLD